MILYEMHTETHSDSDIFHCQILIKTEICRHILVKLHSTTFPENLSSGSQFFYMHTDGKTNKHGWQG